jgi:hypothetical protein
MIATFFAETSARAFLKFIVRDLVWLIMQHRCAARARDHVFKNKIVSHE